MGGRSLGRCPGHVDDPVEAGVTENVMDLRADVDQHEARTRSPDPLLGQQKHTQPGACDVLEPGEVDDPRFGHCVQESQRSIALRGVEPPRHQDLACRTQLDLEHLRVLMLTVWTCWLRTASGSRYHPTPRLADSPRS